MRLNRFFMILIGCFGLIFAGCQKHSENKSTSGAGIVQEPAQISGFLLTVLPGSRSGHYQAGTLVTIAANPAPAGKVFDKWIGALVTNPGLPDTTVIMPAKDTTITAVYRDELLLLTVEGGQGGGMYKPGTIVTITANPPPDGEYFSNWIGSNIQTPPARTTTVTMPTIAMTVRADFKPITAVPTY